MMSLEQCLQLLPDWYKGGPWVKERIKMQTANRKELGLMIGCDPINNDLLEKRLKKVE